MDLKVLKETPPWDWPSGTRKMLPTSFAMTAPPTPIACSRRSWRKLHGHQRRWAEALLSILRRRWSDVARPGGDLPGAVLDHTDTEGFEDAVTLLIAERPSTRSSHRCTRSIWVPTFPMTCGAGSWRRRCARPRTGTGCHPCGARESRRGLAAHRRLLHELRARIRRADSRRAGKREPGRSLRGPCRRHVEVDAAWAHVVAIVTSERSDKSLLLAAIDAVASIRPHEAAEILLDLAELDDEDVVEAVDEALAMASGPSDGDYEDEDDDDGEVIH